MRRIAAPVRELPADVDERDAADRQEPRDLQQPHDDEGQQRAHDDRTGRAPPDDAPLVFGGHVARGEADDRRERRKPLRREEFRGHWIVSGWLGTSMSWSCTPFASTAV